MFKSALLTTILLLTTLCVAQPRGEFIAGDSDGEDFKLYLTFKRNLVMVETLDQTPWRGESKLEKRGKNLYHFTLAFPNEPMSVTLIQSSKDSFVLKSPKESKILRAHRIDRRKPWLKGAWRHEDGGRIVIEDSSVLLKKQETTLVPLKKQGPVYRAVLVKKNQTEDSILLNFVKTNPKTLLVWDEDDGKVQTFTRE